MSDTTSDEDSTQYSDRLAFSESDLAELEAALSAPPVGEVSSSPSSWTPCLRFHSTVLVLLTVGLATLTLTVAQTSESAVVQHLSAIGVVLLTVFAREWFRVHGDGLTRRRRPFFNEQNILDTHGLNDGDWAILGDPDPATPGWDCCDVGMEVDGAPPMPAVDAEDGDECRRRYNAFIREHYGNMMANAERMAAEMELLDRADKTASDAQLGNTNSIDSPSSSADKKNN